MGSGLQSRFKRTAIILFGEIAVSGVWAMIDAEFVTENARWFLTVGLAGLFLVFWADRIWNYIEWERQQVGRASGHGHINALDVADRALTERQRQALIAEASQAISTEEFSVIYFSGSEEAARFARQIADALKAAGWNSYCDIVINQDSNARGVTLAKPVGAAPEPWFNALARGLEEAEIKFSHADMQIEEPRLYIHIRE